LFRSITQYHSSWLTPIGWCYSHLTRRQAGLPDFSCLKKPKRVKIYQTTTELTTDSKIHQMSVKCTNRTLSVSTFSIPRPSKIVFLVWNYSIWQYWRQGANLTDTCDLVSTLSSAGKCTYNLSLQMNVGS
jgi:hypothetical protein